MTEREYEFWRGWHTCEKDAGDQEETIIRDNADTDFVDGYLSCLQWHREEEQSVDSQAG